VILQLYSDFAMYRVGFVCCESVSEILTTHRQMSDDAAMSRHWLASASSQSSNLERGSPFNSVASDVERGSLFVIG